MKIMIQLSNEAVDLLNRKVNGTGGWQSLLENLQSQLVGNFLVLNPSDIGKIIRYTTEYGTGGFEDRLQPILNYLEILINEILDALQIQHPLKLRNHNLKQKHL